jgi:hypothetical protein
LGDLVPAVAVGAGVVHELGKAAFGLVDEAGDQGDGGEVISEPKVQYATRGFAMGERTGVLIIRTPLPASTSHAAAFPL